MTSRDIKPQRAIDPLPQNPAVVYLSSLSSHHSRRTMRTALNTVADIISPKLADSLPKEQRPYRFQLIDWHRMRYEHLQAIRTHLMQQYAPATVNKILAALRGVLDAAFNLGLIDAEEYQRARQVKSVSGHTLPVGRDVRMGEIRALADACAEDDSPAGVRDVAVLALLYTCGLRRAELVALQREDYDASSGQLQVKAGKGRKQRTVYVQGNARDALNRWLDVRGRDSGALFNPVLKNGRILQRGLSDQAVYNVLKKRALQAGVDDFSPHDLRRTFVGDLLDRGADIVIVSKLAGHADVKTTARYDRRPEDAKRKATELLHFPGSGE